MKKSIKRWLPAAALPVVIAVAAVAVPAVADASPRLPDKTADEVLALVSASGDTAYSGTVEQSSDLGLPELPSVGGSSSGSSDSVSTAMELLTGAHTARVYVDGADASRVQVMDTLAERDVVRNGSDVWFYSSEANEATHVTLADKTDVATAVPDATQTPAELAEQLLASIDPSTTVVVGDTARVAGRPVYTLTLTPKSTETLVGSVVLSLDSQTGLPLAVEVSAAGQTAPAFSVAFSSIDFSAPDTALFTFTPPAGATVTEKETPAEPAAGQRQAGEPDSNTHPTVTGEGWGSIVELPTEAAAAAPASATSDAKADAEGDADSTQLLDQLTTQVAEGRIVQTSLVSVLFATDGRIFVGAVPASQLQAAANASE